MNPRQAGMTVTITGDIGMFENSKKWIEKYYPIAASDLHKASAKECVEHSILKWQGLVYAEVYGLHISQGALRKENGVPILWLEGCSCALCERFYQERGDCGDCPLAEELGRACDDGCYEDNLYAQSIKNPRLMVNVLSNLLEKLSSGEIK